MACRIVWSQTAAEDLRQIVQFIALDDATAAASLADRILKRIEQAVELPFSNRAVPEKAEESTQEVVRGHLQPASLTPWVRTQVAKLAGWRCWSAFAGKKCNSMSSPAPS